MNIQIPALPKGILESDLKYPDYKKPKSDAWAKDLEYDERYFTMYYVTGFGWCIPTLHIRNPGRRSNQTTARTYAIRVDTQTMCRVGLGPHVTKTVTVYVRQSRLADLMPYIEMRRKGAVDANMTRDRISTRRAQTSMRRFGLF